MMAYVTVEFFFFFPMVFVFLKLQHDKVFLDLYCYFLGVKLYQITTVISLVGHFLIKGNTSSTVHKIIRDTSRN